MENLEMAATCRSSDSWTCTAVYDLTGNKGLAHTAAWVIGKPSAIVGLVALALLVRWLAHRAIDRVVRRASGGLPSRLTPAAATDHTRGSNRRVQRAKSLGSLMKSLASAVTFGIVSMMVLSEIGVNIAPILASAGVLGLAIGFGAQTLVKDYLAGMFMIFEDQYGVGDAVNLGDVSGTVEAVGLRVTRLRDVDGTVWYVRNGEILRVGNQSQNWARTVLDVAVGYTEDLTRVRRILAAVAHELWEDPEYSSLIIEEPEVWGVQSLSPESIVVRVTLKTAPMEQWNVAREMRERIKARFDAEGIAAPLPQRVVWHRDAGAMPAAGDESNGSHSGE
jgi:small conductance mechanosensitive channel